MSRKIQWCLSGLLTLCVLLLPAPGNGQSFNSGSTGADGAFNPTSNTTLALPPNGVFNFTTINIPAGVTVTFTRNAANTPVSLLATGNVVISGIIDVSGQAGNTLGRPGRGGPGGFDGGAGSDGVTSTIAGAGQGPGGGGGGTLAGGGGGGGGYVAAGTGGSGSGTGAGGAAYGSSLLRPILGGSGGGGGGSSVTAAGGSGGGGGGAIVIASSTNIVLNSNYPSATINADGGRGGDTCGIGSCGAGGGGAGGAIRLIAPTISGNAVLFARGGTYGYPYNGGTGSAGRIRLEAATLTLFISLTSPNPTTAYPQPVFPAAGQPALTIASVGGVAAPAAPAGNVLASPDILLPLGTASPVDVVLTASNIPLGTAILVTATPQSGAGTTATSGGLTGTLASSTATATGLALTLSQTSTLTATATFPLVASAGEGPLYADGEEITHMKIAAVLGGGSTLTYITRSGREVVVQ